MLSELSVIFGQYGKTVGILYTFYNCPGSHGPGGAGVLHAQFKIRTVVPQYRFPAKQEVFFRTYIEIGNVIIPLTSVFSNDIQKIELFIQDVDLVCFGNSISTTHRETSAR